MFHPDESAKIAACIEIHAGDFGTFRVGELLKLKCQKIRLKTFLTVKKNKNCC